MAAEIEMSNREPASERQPEDAPQTEPVWRLIAAALGWILLGFIASVALGFLIGLAGTFTRAQLTLHVTLSLYVGAFAFAGVLLAAARIRGRIVGAGDINAGLANKPVARMPIILCLAVVLAAYAILLRFALPEFGLLSFRADPPASLWLISLNILRSAVVGPLAEESLFRGWLWTGLRKQWGPFSTATLTSGLWLAGHVWPDPTRLIMLAPVAIILAAARYFGESVRAPIALHAMYNCLLIRTPWL